MRKRLDDEAKLRKADEQRKEQQEIDAALAAREKREAQEAQKRAALERARERKRPEEARLAQCVIRPVMSDDEIARCREVRGR